MRLSFISSHITDIIFRMRILYFNTDKKENHDPFTLLYDSNNTSMSHFISPSRSLDFPPEIIQKIVHFIPRSSLTAAVSVNRTWYSLAMPILYRHLYVRTLPHWLLLMRTFSDSAFAAQFGPHVRSLVLKPSPPLISSQLTSYINHRVIENDDNLQPSLRGYVRLERVNFNHTGLEGVETPMFDDKDDNSVTFSRPDEQRHDAAAADREDEQVGRLHENYQEMDTTQKEAEWLSFVTDAQVNSILDYAPQIEYLNLSGCENITEEILIHMASIKRAATATKARPLKGLWLSLLRNMTARALESVMQAEIDLFPTASTNQRQLKHLDLGFQVNITDETIYKLVQCWGSSLTHLRLNSMYELTDAAVHSISTYCPNLRLLHLVRCWKINNDSLQLLSRNCKHLTYISIAFLSRTDEEGIKHLIYSCPELRWLDVTNCGISTFFKNVILEAWHNYRRDHGLSPVKILDRTMFLL
ncbi:hypothetical protein BDF20DRAFT_852038 [Mycotypha africana]|uniref:uncharacterized protein n=1 Tax=Mycotypha africana TaxID=64632 RepID=UPI0023008A4C|nr:uncharacterized protein BDF20DRAFT_852038 [Mycotypha africana]KAI8987754.1 hypothetical protein BDF20DRAFT_852038 [Mycotypha africana]